MDNVILGRKLRKRSEYRELNQNKLHRDQPPALLISQPASMGVKSRKFKILQQKKAVQD